MSESRSIRDRDPSVGAVGPASSPETGGATGAAPRPVGVFIGSYLPYSETFVYDQLRSHRRYRATAFAYQRSGTPERFPFPRVCALAGTERLAYLTLGVAPAFDRIIRSRGIAVLHAHFGTNGVYAAPFARRHRLPLIVTFHGHDVPALIGRNRFTPRYARYALLAGRMLRQADLLLPASRDLADKLIGVIGADPGKVQTHRLGTYLTPFARPGGAHHPDHSGGEGRAARPDGRPSAGPTVLMVGRFV
ncbi:MAG: glycosyltransferase, partial [Myxococcota bacterium]